MTSHIYHPDVHEFGLFPGCPRCEEHAADPRSLDQSMRRRLAAGHIITPLDLLAAQQLGVERSEA